LSDAVVCFKFSRVPFVLRPQSIQLAPRGGQLSLQRNDHRGGLSFGIGELFAMLGA
jgi:hypothetical protein